MVETSKCDKYGIEQEENDRTKLWMARRMLSNRRSKWTFEISVQETSRKPAKLTAPHGPKDSRPAETTGRRSRNKP